MLQCTADKIIELHTFLANAFAEHVTAAQLIINQGQAAAKGEVWRDPRYIGPITFHLWDKQFVIYADTPTRQTTVVQVAGFRADADEMAWVSWREHWTKSRPEEKFVLRDAAFTFYWGPSYDVSQQLFRVEWQDQETGSKTSGHPHWQLDHEPFGTRLDIGAFHFGMAGWEPGDSPRCWQKFPTNTAQLLEWATKSLSYSRQQLLNYPPRPIRLI